MFPAHAHPYEILFFLLSTAALPVMAVLFSAKLADLVRVIRSGTNGATRYNTVDKFRHEVFLFAVAGAEFALSVSSLNNPNPPSAQTLNFIMVGIAIALGLIGDALWTFRRRRMLPILIAEEERKIPRPVPGGKRYWDPPA